MIHRSWRIHFSDGRWLGSDMRHTGPIVFGPHGLAISYYGKAICGITATGVQIFIRGCDNLPADIRMISDETIAAIVRELALTYNQLKIKETMHVQTKRN